MRWRASSIFMLCARRTLRRQATIRHTASATRGSMARMRSPARIGTMIAMITSSTESADSRAA